MTNRGSRDLVVADGQQLSRAIDERRIHRGLEVEVLPSQRYPAVEVEIFQDVFHPLLSPSGPFPAVDSISGWRE